MEELLKYIESLEDVSVKEKLIELSKKTQATLAGLEKSSSDQASLITELNEKIKTISSSLSEKENDLKIVKTVLNIDDISEDKLLEIAKAGKEVDDTHVKNLLAQISDLKTSKESLAEEYSNKIIQMKKEAVVADAISKIKEVAVVSSKYMEDGLKSELNKNIGYKDGEFGHVTDAGNGNMVITGSVDDFIETIIKDGDLEKKSNAGAGASNPNRGVGAKKEEQNKDEAMSMVEKFGVKL